MPPKKRGLETAAALDSIIASKKVKAETKCEGREMAAKETLEETTENKNLDKQKEEVDPMKEEKEKNFKEALESATDDDLEWEYSCFQKQLPPTLPEKIKKKLD